MTKYDVIILGAGPGGYKAAENLAKAGQKVALVEKDSVGGTCLNKGCIPLKSFLHIAKAYEDYDMCKRKGIFISESNNFSIQGLLDYKNRIVTDLKKGLESKLTYLKVDIIHGVGKILGKNCDNMFEVLVGNNTYICSGKLILAMGSKPISFFKHENEGYIVDSEYMLNMEQLPKNIVIIGAGIVGLEMASFLNTFETEVTLIEQRDTIGVSMDCEVASVLGKVLQRKGVKIYINTKVDTITNNEVSCNNGELIFHPELVLETIGRKPVIEREELDKIGVAYSDRGILVNQYCETSVEGVYACGDVIGTWMLAHAAYLEADVLSGHILNQLKELKYDKMPTILYTHPEVSWIGETEESCNAKNITYKKIVIPMSYSGRYMVENGKDNAVFKILYEANSNRLLGAHMMGNYSSEIILALETMIYNNMTIEKMRDLIYPHPTIGEIISQAIELTED
ncbi:dihydrolipoyl dehydrogenase family protein [Anaerocolumna xylanovorans]|uniref:Dihydrolipoamide dehydrogenase n=1 Tax=Anaerocolumna xylanovorans DSM 12503 TaxID=1121345 RepID=A0A1M7Y4A7_9FIRM|nr:NAD(P)/FAD-dependent oxidoreductase [Anaerocolumna xylanovorans]SHO47118.1 dihydrolipoamide dehydrogenase [Anaerocolumna xylanovorans DSM 12503]